MYIVFDNMFSCDTLDLILYRLHFFVKLFVSTVLARSDTYLNVYSLRLTRFEVRAKQTLLFVNNLIF